MFGCMILYEPHELHIINLSPKIEYSFYNNKWFGFYSGIGLSLSYNYLHLQYDQENFLFNGITYNGFFNFGVDFNIIKKITLGPFIKINYFHKNVTWDKSFYFHTNNNDKLPLSGYDIGLRLMCFI